MYFEWFDLKARWQLEKNPVINHIYDIRWFGL